MKLISLMAGAALAVAAQGVVIAPAHAGSTIPAYCSAGALHQDAPTLREGGSATCSSKASGTSVRVRVWCHHLTPSGSDDYYYAYGPWITQNGKTASVAWCEVNDDERVVIAQVK
jgi:hypothetical protein